MKKLYTEPSAELRLLTSDILLKSEEETTATTTKNSLAIGGEQPGSGDYDDNAGAID